MTSLHYTEYGQGNPLILLHGLFGSSTNLRGLAKALSHGRRVVAVDLRNHGRSPHAPGMSYRDMVADLHALMRGLNMSGADFVGHSMGGKTAMVLALTAPQRVRRLVVIDIAPVAYAHSHLDLIDSLQAVDLKTVRSRREVDLRLAEQIPDIPTRLFLLQNLIVEDGVFRWRLNLEAIRAHMNALVSFPDDLVNRQFTGPVLFLAGEQSNYIHRSHHGRIHHLFPNARLLLIADAGHWVQADQPQAVSAAIEDFLNEP